MSWAEREALIEARVGVGSWIMDCRTEEMTWSEGLRTLLEISVVAERDGSGYPIRLIGILQDVSELCALEDAYQKQGGYLSGILARLPQGITVFDETLRLKYRNDRATEVLSLPKELVVSDVRFDDLIMVPALLVEVGKQLSQAVRASDTVARLGGDEFVVVVGQDVDRANEAAHVASQLMQHLSAPYAVGEETGMIVPIGDWVIAQACQQLAHWRAGGPGSLRGAINLSARQLRGKGLPVRVAQLMNEYRLGAETLELEITESSVMQALAQAIALLDSLKASGASLAIDDCGTGYSSLSYLKMFPLDRLKIDRFFVSDIDHDANDAAIAGAAVSLAHNLGLRVFAEGVDTATQLARLQHLGCDELQGYHLCRPLPAAAVERFVRDNLAP